MKNQKEQTTVDWIEQEMLKGDLSMKQILEQAKEMEKQRMFHFAKSFVYTWNYITKGNFESTKDMNKELENLFEETYGGNK